ncbi:MAG: serine hydrolase [Planctomycetes bacterium]|nr:serine hydrolase [Planctomycetota bacterium]
MRVHSALVFWTVSIAAPSVLGFAVTARGERSHTDPTGWYWQYEVSEATVNDRADLGYRLFDLEIEQTAPYRFTTVFVANSGVHAKDWWWRFDQTEAQIEQFMSDNNARILDLEVARVNGQPRLAATMIRNAGSDAVGWWYYYDRSLSFIDSQVVAHDARIIDLDSYVVDGVRLWSAVMVHNAGTHYSDWWWYVNQSPAQIFQKLLLHHARIVDLERLTSTTFAVVLAPSEDKFSQYNFSLDAQQLTDFYRQRGSRIIDLESRVVDGVRRFDVVVLDNTNSVERRLRDIMLPATDGAFGFYSKRVGGPVVARLNDTRSFYPASTIKVLEHLAATDTLERLNRTDASVPRWPDDEVDYHQTPPYPGSEPLSTMQVQMMVNSDNSRTNNIQNAFGRVPIGNGIVQFFGALGRDRINHHAWDTVGLSTATALRHKLGAGGPDVFDPANSATLADLGLLYERVASGAILNASYRQLFYSRMLNYQGPYGNHSLFGVVTGVVQEEAASRGVSAANQQLFLDNLNMAFKAGSLDVNLKYASNAGWISLPVRLGNGSIGARGYVFGTFVDGYTFVNFGLSSSNTPQVTGELLRDSIGSALQTFVP